MAGESVKSLQEFTTDFYQNRHRYLKFTFRFIHIQDVAEDLIYDAFAKLWERRNDLIDTNIEGYYYAILRTNCLLWLRSENIRCKAQSEIYKTAYRVLQYDIASLETFDTNFIFSNEIRNIMLNQLGKMPELTSKIFLDNRFHNLSYEELAGKYGISRFKVTREIQEALRQLRISLQDYLPLLLLAFIILHL